MNQTKKGSKGLGGRNGGVPDVAVGGDVV